MEQLPRVRRAPLRANDLGMEESDGRYDSIDHSLLAKPPRNPADVSASGYPTTRQSLPDFGHAHFRDLSLGEIKIAKARQHVDIDQSSVGDLGAREN
jgi:hypothetical protein